MSGDLLVQIVIGILGVAGAGGGIVAWANRRKTSAEATNILVDGAGKNVKTSGELMDLMAEQLKAQAEELRQLRARERLRDQRLDDFEAEVKKLRREKDLQREFSQDHAAWDAAVIAYFASLGLETIPVGATGGEQLQVRQPPPLLPPHA